MTDSSTPGGTVWDLSVSFVPVAMRIYNEAHNGRPARSTVLSYNSE